MAEEKVSDLCDCLTPGIGQHYALTCTEPNPNRDARLYGVPAFFVSESDDLTAFLFSDWIPLSAEQWEMMEQLRREGPKSLPGTPLPPIAED